MKMRKATLIHSIVSAGSAFALLLMISGCGPSFRYVAHDENEGKEIMIKINVNSEPSGAKVFVNEVFQGNTPVTLTFKAFASRSSRGYNMVNDKGEVVGIAVGPDSYNRMSVAPINTTLKVYKEGYQVETRHYSQIPSEQDVWSNWGSDKILTLNYNWTAFLKSAGPDIDFRLRIKPQQ